MSATEYAEEVGVSSTPWGLPAGGGAGKAGRQPDPPARGGLVSRFDVLFAGQVWPDHRIFR